MPVSQTKQQVIRRHLANTALQAPILPSIQPTRSSFSTEQSTAILDPRILDAVSKALDDGQTHYVDVPGIAPLRGKLAEFVASLSHGASEITGDDIVVTAGMQEARFLSLQTIAESFTSVAIPSIVHPGVKMALGVRHVTVDVIPGGVDEGCLPTLSGMEEALQAGRKLLFLESPSRLTGATFDANSVDAIGQLVERHDAFVIWDQGLAPWAVDPPLHSIFADPSSDHRMTVIGEAWPGFGLENWFIGYIGAHRSWVDRIKTLKQIMSICTSTPAQYAALAAADLFPEWHGAQIAGFAERRAAVAAMARAAGWKILPGSTVNLIAVSGSGGLSPPAFGAGTTGLDGAAFGAPGVFGIAIADHTAAEDLAHTGDGSRLNES